MNLMDMCALWWGKEGLGGGDSKEKLENLIESPEEDQTGHGSSFFFYP